MSLPAPTAGPGGPRLRVALVGDYPTDEDGVVQGGVQSVTHALAHALARRPDVECHVVSAVLNPPTAHRKVGPLHVHYISRLPLPQTVTCRLSDSPALSRVVRAIQPDVVHGQGQDRHALGALNAGCPTVITPHGVLFIESRLLRRNAWDLIGAAKIRLINGWEREVFGRAGHMILISRYLTEVYGGMLTAPSTFIDNPINRLYFDLPRAPEAGRLLFAGTVVPRKCVPDLVRAALLLRDSLQPGQCPGAGPPGPGFRLRIAGPLLDAAVERQLRSMIKAHRLERHVALLGALSEADLREEYAKAQVLLLASREETSPQVIAQAMACGLPTVAPASGGIPAMIEDGATGLLYPFGEPDRCAQQIERLLRDPSLGARISSRIVDEAGRRFHPDSVATQTTAVYRQLLRGARQPLAAQALAKHPHPAGAAVVSPVEDTRDVRPAHIPGRVSSL